jgi:hypothetical protein
MSQRQVVQSKGESAKCNRGLKCLRLRSEACWANWITSRKFGAMKVFSADVATGCGRCWTKPQARYDERLKSRGCGRVTCHQETRDPQLACISLFVAFYIVLTCSSSKLCFGFSHFSMSLSMSRMSSVSSRASQSPLQALTTLGDSHRIISGHVDLGISKRCS